MKMGVHRGVRTLTLMGVHHGVRTPRGARTRLGVETRTRLGAETRTRRGAETRTHRGAETRMRRGAADHRNCSRTVSGRSMTLTHHPHT